MASMSLKPSKPRCIINLDIYQNQPTDSADEAKIGTSAASSIVKSLIEDFGNYLGGNSKDGIDIVVDALTSGAISIIVNSSSIIPPTEQEKFASQVLKPMASFAVRAAASAIKDFFRE